MLRLFPTDYKLSMVYASKTNIPDTSAILTSRRKAINKRVKKTTMTYVILMFIVAQAACIVLMSKL